VLYRLDELRAVPAAVRFVSFEPLIGSVAGANLKSIHWAIVGGESGPQARPLDTRWVDEIFDQCTDADTAFFFKQWGGKNKKVTGRTYRDRLWDDLPDLRI
jgi:protein gp37